MNCLCGKWQLTDVVSCITGDDGTHHYAEMCTVNITSGVTNTPLQQQTFTYSLTGDDGRITEASLECMRLRAEDAEVALRRASHRCSFLGNRATALRNALDELFRFASGLQLSDQPLAIQREHREIIHRMLGVLKPGDGDGK